MSSLVFGEQNLCNSLPRQLFCTRMILKNRMNSSFSSNHPGSIHPIFQTAAMTFAFSSVVILLLWPQLSELASPLPPGCELWGLVALRDCICILAATSLGPSLLIGQKSRALIGWVCGLLACHMVSLLICRPFYCKNKVNVKMFYIKLSKVNKIVSVLYFAERLMIRTFIKNNCI